MNDKKLNNLFSIEDYSDKKFFKKSTPTKRTEVAKDILESVETTGKNVNERPKSKEEVVFKKFNNIYSINDFTEKDIIKSNKPTKRTEVANDILQEKKKEESKKGGLTAGQKKLPKALQDAILKKQGKKVDDDCDCKKSKKDEEKKEDEPKKGLTPGQKKLPEALQKAILKRQNK